MSGHVRTALWLLLVAQFLGWWVVVGLFAFGVIGPISNGVATYLVFTALFGIGSNFAAAAS